MARLGTIKEAASLLGVSAATLRRWDRDGRLRPIRHRGNRYRLYDLDALGAAPPLEATANGAGSRGPFVGRSGALGGLAERFRDEPSLITIVGAAGVGKSRLVERFVAHRPRWLVTRAWQVDIEGLSSDDDLKGALGTCLGLRSATPPLAARLAARLEERGPAIMVVDHADGLEREGRGLIGDLLTLAPSVVWLVTARSPLGLGAETIYELGPLGTEPDGGEALELFVSTCRSLDVPLVPADRSAIAAIVRTLDGLPLSIEIAAARCAVISPAGLLEELRREEDWGSLRRHAGRGRSSLMAVIGGALASLAPPLRRALIALAACQGGFDGETAAALVGADRAEEVLSGLRHRSLLRVSVLEDGRRRFWIDASVARISLATVAARDRGGRLQAHAEHFVSLAEPAAEAVRRTGDVVYRRWLREEQLNLLSIVERAQAGSVPLRLGARALLSLEPRWLAEGRARAFMERLNALRNGRTLRSLFPETERQVRAAIAEGVALGLLGRSADSRRVLDGAAKLAQREGHEALAAEALLMLSVRHRQQGELRRSLALAERAEAVLVRSAHRRIHAMSLALAGLVLLQLGELDASEAKNERARALLAGLADQEREGLALANLAQVDQERGAFERSRLRFDQALASLRASGVDVYVASYVGMRAMLDHEMGHVGTARAGYDEAVRSLAEQGIQHVEALIAAHRGALRAATGDEAGALEDFDDAESAFSRGGLATFERALALHRGQLDVAWARQAFARGDATAAREHLGRAQARLRDAGPKSDESQGFDARFAFRLLTRAIQRAVPREVLYVGPRSAWFQLEGRPRVALGHRAPLCRLLSALVAEPRGAVRSVPELVALGWPGERILPDAGRRRVQVAISTLRRLGLEGRLSTREGGYEIDPAIALQLVTDDEDRAALGIEQL